MSNNYLAFDIDTAKQLPWHVDDLKTHRPLGICCTVALAQDEDKAKHFFSRNADATISGQMSRVDLQGVVGYLSDRVASGYTIVT